MKIETIIMSRCPKLSGRANEYSRGYRKLALVDVDRDLLNNLNQKEPRMISERSRGVIGIRRVASLYFGKGIRSEGKDYLDFLIGERDKINDSRSN